MCIKTCCKTREVKPQLLLHILIAMWTIMMLFSDLMIKMYSIIPTFMEYSIVPMNGRGIGPGIPFFLNILYGQVPYLYKKKDRKSYGEIKHTSAIKARLQKSSCRQWFAHTNSSVKKRTKIVHVVAEKNVKSSILTAAQRAGRGRFETRKTRQENNRWAKQEERREVKWGAKFRFASSVY